MFSTIFQKDSAQKEVFVKAVKPVLEEFFNGQNTLLLAYGVTNSGKTYTITGIILSFKFLHVHVHLFLDVSIWLHVCLL